MEKKTMIGNIMPKPVLLGQGACGTVLKDFLPVAVKKIKNFDKAALEELETLRSLNLGTPIYMAPEVCV